MKTPRIFGIYGVYKRLAIYLGLVDVHLGCGPNAERLADAWARGLGLSGLREARPLLARWTAGIKKSLGEASPRAKPGWGGEGWRELAHAFAPWKAAAAERRFLRELLHGADDRRLGALPAIWRLHENSDDGFREEALHVRLGKEEPGLRPLLGAIQAYEAFARSLQDAFDVLRAEAGRTGTQGYVIPDIARDKDFARSVKDLHLRYDAAHRALADVDGSLGLQGLFDRRFRPFSDPLDAGACSIALCDHHQDIQKAKSADGKRPWFDRIGPQRIYLRHAYREARRDILPDDYVHYYRGRPIRRFRGDLQ